MQFTDAEIGYLDARQSSLATIIQKPPLRFGRDAPRPLRLNRPIDDGYLRAFSGGVTIDTRPLLKQAGRDVQLGATNFTRLALTGEWSPGSSLSSDFTYRRAALQLVRRQESFGMGVTTLIATGGA